MRLTDRLNRAQKIVIVIATGIALASIGLYLANRGSATPGLGDHLASGWSSRFASRPRLPRWLRLIIWLVLDGIWASTSMVVLRSPRGSGGPA